MAKITITADTETGEMNCDVGGKMLENMVSCELYATSIYDYDTDTQKQICRFAGRMKPQKENGVTVFQSAMASVNPEAATYINSGKCQEIVDGIIVVNDVSAVSSDIAKAMNLKF